MFCAERKHKFFIAVMRQNSNAMVNIWFVDLLDTCIFVVHSKYTTTSCPSVELLLLPLNATLDAVLYSCVVCGACSWCQ